MLTIEQRERIRRLAKTDPFWRGVQWVLEQTDDEEDA